MNLEVRPFSYKALTYAYLLYITVKCVSAMPSGAWPRQSTACRDRRLVRLRAPVRGLGAIAERSGATSCGGGAPAAVGGHPLRR
jgi:hypothetical protein